MPVAKFNCNWNHKEIMKRQLLLRLKETCLGQNYKIEPSGVTREKRCSRLHAIRLPDRYVQNCSAGFIQIHKGFLIHRVLFYLSFSSAVGVLVILLRECVRVDCLNSNIDIYIMLAFFMFLHICFCN